MDDDVWADSEEDERIVDHAISSEGQEDGSGEGGSGDKARKGRSSDYDKRMAELEWNKLHRVHGVDGYREGIEEAKEAQLQKGFDDGFEEGAIIGITLGRLRGRTSALVHAFKLSSAEPTDPILASLLELHREISGLTYDDLFSDSHFKALVPALDPLAPKEDPSQSNEATTNEELKSEESYAQRTVQKFSQRLEEVETQLRTLSSKKTENFG